MIPSAKTGGRCVVSAVASEPSFHLQGRGGSPSGPKIQAQRAVKPKSTTRSSRETRVERRAPFPLSCPVECEALFHWGPPQRLCRLRHQLPVLGRRPSFQLFRFSVFQLFPHRPSSATSPRGMRSLFHWGPSSAIGGIASVLGITGDGRAALFGYSRHAVEPRGYVDRIHLESQATGIDSPAALQSWLEETIVTMSPLSQA